MNFQRQWDLLTKSAEAGILPHALLFSGEEKIGKKEFAISFAKYLIGEGIESGLNPDFVYLEPEKKNIQIKQVRDLIEKLSFKPYMADYKIGMVNEAHLMNKEAQNCFLKFLEEPTDKTHLILITPFPYLLLPTILSRTQKIRFYPPKGFKRGYNNEFAKDLARLANSDLAFRFNYAKSKEEANLPEIFDSWLGYLRDILMKKIKGQEVEEFTRQTPAKLKDIIEAVQKAKVLVSTTNANQKLVLEILLMEL
jgi:DNA polymerase III delta prime subunit